jgi:small subunit ribosomal protein S21
MLEVQVKDNTQDSFEKAMRKFKKLVNNDGFIKEIQERRYFQSESEKKRLKKKQSKRRNENGRV